MKQVVFESLLDAFATLLTAKQLFHLFAGVLLGLAIGVFPGLGGIVGLSLLLPFLYGMDQVSALAMLIGLLAVIPTSDTFTSVLMGIPGSTASQATVLDGFPLAKRGEAARALSAAFSASLLGGVFGAATLTAFVQVARPVMLVFGSAELLMLALFGLSMVGVLSGKSLIKGICACALGLVFGSVGAAPATGEFRLIVGIDYLYDGLPLVIVGLGMFAFPEIVDLMGRDRPISDKPALGKGWLGGVRDMLKHKWLCLRCAGLGSLIGAIPGLGGSVVDWIAYGHVVQSSRDKSRFGEGDIRGVLAPESANNAKDGGALIPTLVFGIPGSGSMAVFLGGMVLIGIEAGPSMVTTDINLTYTIIWSLALANVIGAGLCLALAHPISRLTSIPFRFLAPFMIMLISFAAFQATRDAADLWALFVLGVLGILLKRFGWSRPAFLIGFVLAPEAEAYLNMAAQFYGWRMFTRPVVLIILLVTVVSVWVGRRRGVDEVAAQEPETGSFLSSKSRLPQLAFGMFALVVFVYAIYDAQQQSSLGGIFPTAVALAATPLALALLLKIWRADASDPVLFDLEVGGEGSDSSAPPGTWWRWLAWLGGLYLFSQLIGFVAAIAGFFVAFLRFRSRESWKRVISLTVAAILFLALFGHFLALDFPRGLVERLWDVLRP